MLARSHPIASIGSSFLTYPGGRSFSSRGSGCSFLQYPQWAPLPDFEVSSDASGALGYGAVFQGHWFSGAWLPTQVSQSIEYKELFPIVVAAYLWGPRWASKRVNFLLDNHSVVEILRSGTSRAPTIMSLVRYPGCLGTSVVRGQGSPPPPFFPLRFGCVSSESPFGLEWGSWLGCGGLPAMGAVFLSRGWLATVEAPGYPRHPPST